MRREKETKRRITAAIMLGIFMPTMVPGKELGREINTGKQELEYYLERASRERSAESWGRIAEEGILSAMAAWEKEKLEELERTEYEEKKAEKEKEFRKTAERNFIGWITERYMEENRSKRESRLHEQLKKKAAEWKYKDQNGNETREVNQEEAGAAREQWNRAAEEVITLYEEEWKKERENIYTELTARLAGLNLEEEETKVLLNRYTEKYNEITASEYERTAKYEENLLMRNVLYDQESLKKKSDKEAAGIIAREIARETEKKTGDSLSRLMEEFREEIKSGKTEDIETREREWYEEFERELNSSLEKWKEAEQRYLAARGEWELRAEREFINNEEVWEAGFEELERRKESWNEKIYKEIREVREELEERKTEIKEELSTGLRNYEALLENEKDINRKSAEIQKNIYEQSRQLMKTSREGIENWKEHWSEKYNLVYSYWKLKDAEVYEKYFGDEETFKAEEEKTRTTAEDGKVTYDKSVIKRLEEKIKNWNKAYLEIIIKETEANESKITDRTTSKENRRILERYIEEEEPINREKVKETVKFLKNELKNEDTVFSGEYRELFDTNDFILGSGEELTEWTRKLSEYTEQAESAAIELYKKTGYALEGEEAAEEIEVQILKAKALEEYWMEEVKTAEALNEYVKDRSSKVEMLTETEIELKKASEEYIKAQEKYSQAVEELEQAEKETEETKEKISKKTEEMKRAQEEMRNAQEQFENITAAYKGGEDRIIQNQIKEITERLSGNRSKEEQKRNAREYYEALEKETKIKQEAKKETAIKYLREGTGEIKPIKEMEELKGLKAEEVLRTGFDIRELQEKAGSECGEDAARIQTALQEYHSGTTDRERKEELKLIIESSVINIQTYYAREIRKRELAIAYLEGREPEKAENTETARLEAYLEKYIEYYRERKKEEDAEEIKTLEEKYKKNKKEALEYIKREREKESVRKILEGGHFTEGEKAVLKSMVKQELEAKGQNINEDIENVIKNYKTYKTAETEAENREARKAVGAVMEKSRTAEMSTVELQEYIIELNRAGEKLSEAGKNALNLYINELIYSHGIKKV